MWNYEPECMAHRKSNIRWFYLSFLQRMHCTVFPPVYIFRNPAARVIDYEKACTILPLFFSLLNLSTALKTGMFIRKITKSETSG